VNTIRTLETPYMLQNFARAAIALRGRHALTRTSIAGAAALMIVAAPPRSDAQTQAGSAAAFPPVGAPAPDFTATATDSTGRAIPVSLAQYKGKVVVLAFYPLDRSSGCTAELSKFRDDYATLFGNGAVVLPASVDSLASHASWAKDAHFPFVMISDRESALATEYGSQGGARPYFRRTVFVIGKDGRIAWENTRFNPLAQNAYDELASEIRKASGE
jgi:peroxiredoxin Q/BCP